MKLPIPTINIHGMAAVEPQSLQGFAVQNAAYAAHYQKCKNSSELMVSPWNFYTGPPLLPARNARNES